MKITLLPGDGIGVEIVDAAVEVLDAAAKKFGMAIEYDRQLIGGAAIDATGVPLPEATIASAKTADAVLLGAVADLNGIMLLPRSVLKRGCLEFVKRWVCTVTCVRSRFPVLSHIYRRLKMNASAALIF